MHCEFPSGVEVVPFAIDSYGHWGNSFSKFLKVQCHVATGGIDKKTYNRLITKARNLIQVAHTRALGYTLQKCMTECVQEDEKILCYLDGNKQAVMTILMYVMYIYLFYVIAFYQY